MMDNGIQSNGFWGGGGGCAARTQQRAEIHGVVMRVRILRGEENTQREEEAIIKGTFEYEGCQRISSGD